MRFDKFVAEKLGISRNQAASLIKENKILFNGEICEKVSLEVTHGEIGVADEIYVSRGALKLKGFLRWLKDEREFAINGLNALDIGASTGGFVQILLENGATSVLEPELEPWGQRTCYIADPEGNLIEIGSWNKPYEEKDLTEV